MDTIRAFINLLFFGVWTIAMVSLAVTSSVLRRDPEVFVRAQRVWARGLVRFWGVRLDVVGADRMRDGQSYVVVSNHLSYVDIVVLFLALPTTPGFLAKRELMRIPFLASALRAGRHVIIDRQDRHKAQDTIAKAAAQVREGKTVLIFPEGTRGDSDTVGTFKKGAFHLAKAAGVPILPIGLNGTRAIFPRRSLLVRPGAVAVRIGDPIPAEEVVAAHPGELCARARATIIELSRMPARETVRAVSSPRSDPAVER